jgi:hypothetical protein
MELLRPVESEFVANQRAGRREAGANISVGRTTGQARLTGKVLLFEGRRQAQGLPWIWDESR